MKKVLLTTLALILGSTMVLADEVTPQQTVKNDQAYFTANIQKQPKTDKQKQGITNHFTFFTINVQVNGKIDNFNAPTKPQN